VKYLLQQPEEELDGLCERAISSSKVRKEREKVPVEGSDHGDQNGGVGASKEKDKQVNSDPVENEKEKEEKSEDQMFEEMNTALHDLIGYNNADKENADPEKLKQVIQLITKQNL